MAGYYPDDFNPYLNLVYDERWSCSLAVHNLDGSLRGFISNPISLTYYDRYGEVPTLEVEWTEQLDVHRNLFTEPGYVALVQNVRYRSGIDADDGAYTWHEYRNSRFIWTEHDWDRRDPTGKHTSRFVGALSLFSGSHVLPVNLVDGKRLFKDKTPGAIVGPLFNQAKERGELRDVRVAFTGTHDSFGNEWPATITRAYEPGVDLLTLITDLHATNAVDVWMDGLTLCMSIPGEWEKRYGGDDYRAYIRDAQVETSPESHNWRDQFSTVVIMGDEGKTWEYRNGRALPYGNRTRVISAGGVSDAKTATETIALNPEMQPDLQNRMITREWEYVDDDVTPDIPNRNFSTGDVIFVDDNNAHKRRMRVQDFSIKLSTENGATRVTFAVSCGDIRSDLMTRAFRQAKAANDGAEALRTGKASKSSFASHPGHPRTGTKLNPDGLQSYNATGGKTLSVDPETGDVKAGWTALDKETGEPIQPGLYVEGESGRAELNGVYRSSNYVLEGLSQSNDEVSGGALKHGAHVAIDDTKPYGIEQKRDGFWTQVVFAGRDDAETTQYAPRLFMDARGSDLGTAGKSLTIASGRKLTPDNNPTTGDFTSLRLTPTAASISFNTGVEGRGYPENPHANTSVKVSADGVATKGKRVSLESSDVVNGKTVKAAVDVFKGTIACTGDMFLGDKVSMIPPASSALTDRHTLLVLDPSTFRVHKVTKDQVREWLGI